MKAAAPPDPIKDVKSSEQMHDVSLEAKPAKDCKKGSKGKSTLDRQPAKSRASSAAPRITIKLVAKKKIKTVKEPQKKSAKKLKMKGDQDEPKTKDIEGDQILSAHVKLKAEPQEDEHGTEDKGGGTVPVRRRGRSALKTTEPVCQTSAKVVVSDQKSKEKESVDQPDSVKESGTVEPKSHAKKLKHKETAAGQGPEVNQLVTRRSNRVTNPLSKRATVSAPAAESLSTSDAVVAASKSEASRTAEAKPLAGSNRRRQSRRLNKNDTVPENQGLSLSETDNSAVQPSDSLPLKNEDTRVPSLKLIKIRNPKYNAQSAGKNTSRKKKRRKFIWTLTLVKGGSQTPCAENTFTVTPNAVSEVDQPALCDTSVSENLKGIDDESKLDDTVPQESENTEKNESNQKDSQNNAEEPLEEKTSLQVEVAVEHTAEASPQEITKTDCGKVVPPLQIKKVSSPGKHKSSKPSFLIQQVSPVAEKMLEREEKEDVLIDQNETNEDKSACLDVDVTPTRRLRRRTSSLDSSPTKSVSQKPVNTPKRKLRASVQDEDAPQVHVEDSSQVSTEDSSSQVLPENPCLDLTEEPSQTTFVNSSEIVDKDTSNIAEDPSQLPGDASPPKVENEVEPQINEAEPQFSEAKPLPVPSKPRRCRNNKLGKKKSLPRKKAVVSTETAVNTEPVTVDTTNTEPVQEEDTQPLVTEVSQPETKDCPPPETKQDPVSVEEEQIQPSVKEEMDIQSIESQQSLSLECQTSDLNASMASQKKGKKKRKNLIGQRQKHRHRSKDGKFAPLKLPESEQTEEGDGDSSTPLAANAPSPSFKLIGVHKKYKKKQSSLQFIGSKRPKPKVISKLIDTGLDKDSLKQEETDTLVDGGQADVAEAQRSKSKFIKNIKHFIMPVVSARSSRVIKTPQRFMDDAGMSVLPRRNSPKKGLQLGLQIRPGKRRDDGADRAISPILPIDEEDILSEAQLDVDLFSAQDLDESIDLADSLFSERKSVKNDKNRSLLKNSSFKCHLPEKAGKEVNTLDKTPENKGEDLFSLTPVDKPTELSTDLLDVQKKKSCPKFTKQTTHLKIYQRLKKPQLGLKSKNPIEPDGASKPLQPPVDLAEGLDDEAMSISLRQRDTSLEKDKSKLKIEDLDTPGVVRKVSVCVRTTNPKSLTLQHGQVEDIAAKDTAQPHSGNTILMLSNFRFITYTIVQTRLYHRPENGLYCFHRRVAVSTELRQMWGHFSWVCGEGSTTKSTTHWCK